ncbi:MAG: VCBS repeat-containing protein [Planctomycetes bacterium]|nr:VCBS repeat-containing protein [Planctomycetota bacterium]
MDRPARLPIAAGLLAALVAPSRLPNTPPQVTLELAIDGVPLGGEALALDDESIVRLRLRVDDLDGDRVHARLLAAPDAQGFVAIRGAAAGATREWLWNTSGAAAGRHEFLVEAWDEAEPQRRVRASAALLLQGSRTGRAAQFHDLEGDGRDELFVVAAAGDVGGVVDAGAIARFDRLGAHGPGPLPTLCVAASPQPGDAVGAREGGSFEFGDVTGDGRPDLIGRSGRELLIWSAPPAGRGELGATATLRSSDPTARLGGSGGSDFVLVDVSGDGVLDLVVAAPEADLGGVTDAGELAVFLGGPTLSGVRTPDASLRLPGAVAGDALGRSAASGALRGVQSFRVGDVTGDGRVDLVVAAAAADRGGVVDVGVVAAWAGGPALLGVPAPHALLAPSGLVAGSFLPRLAESEALHLVDVSGDGVLDVVAGAAAAGTGGALFCWRGGPLLTGTRAADAVLQRSAPVAHDELGAPDRGPGLLFHDLDGDGTSDLLAVAPRADVGGVVDAGALFWWRGGAWSGVVHETATLARASPGAFERLGEAGGGVQLADVTGDGRADVVVGCSRATGAAPESGVVAVWAGGVAWSGATAPSAELRANGAAPFDRLGEVDVVPGGAGCGVLLLDVTGDAIADVVGVAPAADRAGIANCGAAYVWSGGAALAGGGVVLPVATLADPFAIVNGYLGHHPGAGWGVRAGDFTGDGVADLALLLPSLSGMSTLVAAARARVFVFAGGAALAGTPVPFATLDSPQQRDEAGVRDDDLLLVDLDDDGAAELLLHAPKFDHPSGRNVDSIGALLRFRGGRAGLSTAVALHDPRAADGAAALSRFLAPRDVDSDGRLDLALLQPRADRGSGRELGQLLLWRAPGSLGSPPPLTLPPGTTPPPLPDPTLLPELASPGLRLGDRSRLGE